MQEANNFDSFPEHPINQNNPSKLFQDKQVGFFNSKHSLHPIDETDEFQDPFSDLNLFLSKKIKSTLKKHGSTKKWSTKIQNELIQGILPDFKKQFPRYRLGLSALRKVWEKVSFYYSKVSVQEEAFSENGDLNIDYMIKKNLGDYLNAHKEEDLAPVTTSHKIAIKLSECIATLQGERPRVDYLTKKIWAAQKHLVQDLPIKFSKNPFEEYGKLDKLIVKTLLEKTSQREFNFVDLHKSIKRSITQLKNFVLTTKSQDIYQMIAKRLATKLYDNSYIVKNYCEDDLESIEQFILYELEAGSVDGNLNPIELTQRIIALYPLLSALPKDLTSEDVENALSCMLSDDDQNLDASSIPSSLMVFLTTELHFIQRKNLFTRFEDILDHLINTINLSLDLPDISNCHLNDLEITVWNLFANLSNQKSPFDSLVENELSTAMLDSVGYSFQNTVYIVLHYFQKAKSVFIETQDLSNEELSRKIEIWALQNDMLCRYLHFDPNHEILKLIRKHERQVGEDSHETFVKTITTNYLHLHPLAKHFAKGLQSRVYIFYKFFWYHEMTDSSETTLDRFVKWHELSLKNRNNTTSLMKVIASKLPITPLYKKFKEQS